MTPPEVEPVLPATDAPLDGSIEMTFSESIATAGTISLNNGIGTLTAADANLSGNTYTISYAGLAYSTGYTITITGFQDAAGNTMAENGTHSFTTKAAPIHHQRGCREKQIPPPAPRRQ